MVVFWGPLFGADYCLAMFLTRYRDPLGYAGHPNRSDFSTTDKIVCPWYRRLQTKSRAMLGKAARAVRLCAWTTKTVTMPIAMAAFDLLQGKTFINVPEFE
jgi:hypothetical protein